MAHSFRHLFPCLIGVAFSACLLLPAAQAAEADTSPRIDLSRPNPRPAYSHSALRIGETGTAIVLVQVDDGGDPVEVQLSQSAGFADLDQAALAAVRHWHFVPAVKDGRRVTQWTAVRVQFKSTGVETETAEAEGAAAEERERIRVICKDGVGDTGSRIPGPKKCLPKWKWDELKDNSQRDLTTT